MTQLEILRLAQVGVCQRLDREDRLIELLKSDGTPAPIAERRRARYMQQFCELSDLIGAEEKKVSK